MLTVQDDPDPTVIVVPAVTPAPDMVWPTTIAPDCTEVTVSDVPEMAPVNVAAELGGKYAAFVPKLGGVGVERPAFWNDCRRVPERSVMVFSLLKVREFAFT